MILWRISNYGTLEGRGGIFASGRWHTQGRPVIYLAATPAGALAETLVHLELEPGNFPASYKLLKAEVPEEISMQTVGQSDLAPTWQDNLVLTRTLGDEWLVSESTALLRVPSVLIPETFNFLLNPRHADAARARVLWHREYPWDERLLE